MSVVQVMEHRCGIGQLAGEAEDSQRKWKRSLMLVETCVWCLLGALLSQLADGEAMTFAGIKLRPPLSTSLMRCGYSDPLPIQAAAIPLLTSGLSCILHAETGSGKTLAYLLPVLKRLFNNEKITGILPIQSLIIVPTKELAIQVGTEIAMLTMNQDGEDTAIKDTATNEFSDMVKVCLTNIPKSEVKSIKQPIIVGTPVKILDLLKNLSPKEVSNINYIVIDEVDKVIHAAGKYASNDEKRTMRTNFKPIEDIMAIILALRSSEEMEKLQVVAASATVGRPLRRELYKLISGNDKFADIPVIRPIPHLQPMESRSSIVSSNDDGDSASSKASRKVYIPSQINHIALVCNDGNDGELGYKLAIAKEKWLHYKKHEGVKKALLFVPAYEDIAQAESILKFWGMSDVCTLEKSLGTDDVGKNVNEILRKALNNKVKRVDSAAPTTESAKEELIVLSYACARGLHPPKNMDEYLHLAGRTSRQGNKKREGSIMTIVDLDELKRLQSWETPMNINFEVVMK